MGTDGAEEAHEDGRREDLILKACEGQDVVTFVNLSNEEIKGATVTVICLESAADSVWGGAFGEYRFEELALMAKNGVPHQDRTATVFVAPQLVAPGEEETAYFVRWFNPEADELDDCHHGNLGAAHLIYARLRTAGSIFLIGGNPPRRAKMTRRAGGIVAMELDSYTVAQCQVWDGDDPLTQVLGACAQRRSLGIPDRTIQPITLQLLDALGLRGHVLWAGTHFFGLVLLTSLAKLHSMEPDFDEIVRLSSSDRQSGTKPPRSIYVAAFGDESTHGPYDFQFRCFSPDVGTNEEQLTTIACGILGQLRASHWYHTPPNGGSGYYICRQCSGMQAEFLVRCLGDNKVSVAGRASLDLGDSVVLGPPSLWTLISSGAWLEMACCSNRAKLAGASAPRAAITDPPNPREPAAERRGAAPSL